MDLLNKIKDFMFKKVEEEVKKEFEQNNELFPEVFEKKSNEKKEEIKQRISLLEDRATTELKIFNLRAEINEVYRQMADKQAEVNSLKSSIDKSKACILEAMVETGTNALDIGGYRYSVDKEKTVIKRVDKDTAINKFGEDYLKDRGILALKFDKKKFLENMSIEDLEGTEIEFTSYSETLKEENLTD